MKSIIFAGNNLFFSTKVTAQLKKLGYSVQTVSACDSIDMDTAAGASAMIIDLASAGASALELPGRFNDIPLIGFSGHNDTANLENARAAGYKIATTNGRITSDLQAILKEIEGI